MYRVYQVQQGETLDSIAKNLNTTVDALKRLNGINNNIDLLVGSFIIVPMVDDRFINYTVKNGDSIYSIARAYDVEPDLLLKLNGLEKDDYIYPNQEIIIPTKNYKFYVTKDGDTLSSIIDNLKIDYNTLLGNNKELFLEADQLIIYK